MVVYKYILDLTDRQVVSMPQGAVLLSVQNQHEDIVLWANVDPQAPMGGLEIVMCGTGHEAPNMPHVGTVQLQGGDLVLHIFQGAQRA